MSVLYFAVPIAIALGASALITCIYCIRSGQFDDLDSPATRILIDEEKFDQNRKDKSPDN